MIEVIRLQAHLKHEVIHVRRGGETGGLRSETRMGDLSDIGGTVQPEPPMSFTCTADVLYQPGMLTRIPVADLIQIP